MVAVGKLGREKEKVKELVAPTRQVREDLDRREI